MRAFHDAVRLGDIRAVDGIARLTEASTAWSAGSPYATGVPSAAHDADALDAVAAAFTGIGMHGAAADASMKPSGCENRCAATR